MAKILLMPNVTTASFIHIPDAEYKVLKVLDFLNEAHGPAISRASNGSISVAAIYKLLGRLEQRGLVHKREEFVPIGDITARRVLYKVCDAVIRPLQEIAYEATTETAGRADIAPIQEVKSLAANLQELAH